MSAYPCLEFDLPKLRHNLFELSQRCKAAGIRLAGAVKGVQSLPRLVREYLPYCDQLALSRLSQASHAAAAYAQRDPRSRRAGAV